MKQSLLILIAFFSINQWTTAQELTLGPEQKGKRTEIISDILHADETGYYALRQSLGLLKPFAPIIEKYNNDMVRVYQTRLDEFTETNINEEAFFTFKNRLFVAGSKKDRSKKRVEYFFREISKKTGKMTGKIQKIGTEKIEKKSAIANLDAKISRDSSKLGLFLNDFSINFFPIFNSKKKNENFAKFTLKVFNDKLEEQWSRKVKLPYNQDRLTVLKYDVDNNGDVYVLTSYREENWRERRRNNQAWYTYKILAYRQGGEEVDKYDVTLKDNYISDITFDIDNRNNLVCSGFFSEKFVGGLAGTFIMTIDSKTKEISRQDTKKFDTTELGLFMKERKAKKGKEISSNFDLKDFVLRSDGGAVLIGESFYISTYTTTSTNGSVTTRTVYNYGPLIIVNVNPDGKIEWVSKIVKRQRSETQAYSSYAMSIVADKMYFIFNKGIKKRSNVMAVSVDSKGKVSEKELFRVKDEKMLIRVPGCEQIADREMIVYGEWRKKFRFGKLKF
jgi:hypothetical protein